MRSQTHKKEAMVSDIPGQKKIMLTVAPWLRDEWLIVMYGDNTFEAVASRHTDAAERASKFNDFIDFVQVNFGVEEIMIPESLMAALMANPAVVARMPEYNKSGSAPEVPGNFGGNVLTFKQRGS